MEIIFDSEKKYLIEFKNGSSIVFNEDSDKVWLQNYEGEGMQVNEEILSELLDKYVRENI